MYFNDILNHLSNQVNNNIIQSFRYEFNYETNSYDFYITPVKSLDSINIDCVITKD